MVCNKTRTKSYLFDLAKKVDTNLKYGNDFIIKRNEVLVEDTIQNKTSCVNMIIGDRKNTSMKMVVMNT